MIGAPRSHPALFLKFIKVSTPKNHASSYHPAPFYSTIQPVLSFSTQHGLFGPTWLLSLSLSCLLGVNFLWNNAFSIRFFYSLHNFSDPKILLLNLLCYLRHTKRISCLVTRHFCCLNKNVGVIPHTVFISKCTTIPVLSTLSSIDSPTTHAQIFPKLFS